MASSPSPSTLDAKHSIELSGFCLAKDEETEDAGARNKGRLFAKFYAAGYRTKTPDGLDFIFRNTIGYSVCLKTCSLLYSFSYGIGNREYYQVYHNTASLGVPSIL